MIRKKVGRRPLFGKQSLCAKAREPNSSLAALTVPGPYFNAPVLASGAVPQTSRFGALTATFLESAVSY